MIKYSVYCLFLLNIFNLTYAQQSSCPINHVCYALDQSGSINNPIFNNRYEDVRTFTINSARRIDSRTTDTTYSAYGFSNNALTIQQPTQELEKKFIKAVNDQTNMPFSGTNIISGLDKCLDALKGATGNLVAILVTDGRGRTSNPEPYKKKFLDSGISLVTVGIGNNVDEKFLKGLAKTEEFYISSTNTDDLVDKTIIITNKLCDAPKTPSPLPSPSPSVIDACAEAYHECEFQFFGQNTVPSYSIGGRPDSVFTDRIVSKKDPNVGVLNTNGIDVEFINANSKAKSITKFGKPHLTPTHFKPFSFRNKVFATGIGHQTFTGNQKWVSRKKCVRVWFTNYQVISTNPHPRVVGNVNGAQKIDNKCVVFKTN